MQATLDISKLKTSENQVITRDAPTDLKVGYRIYGLAGYGYAAFFFTDSKIF